MGTIWIKEFTGGLDTRRLPETSTGGIFLFAQDGHISRGGEFQKRPAFVKVPGPAASLPAGTKGVAGTTDGVYVFGTTAKPAGFPDAYLTYHRLHPLGGTVSLVSVLSVEYSALKLYVIATFSDGSTRHFYDGVEITDYNGTKASASFTITGGGQSDGTPASASIALGYSNGSNTISAITIGGQNMIGGGGFVVPIDLFIAAGNLSDTINTFLGGVKYTADYDGATVTITRNVAGAGSNGLAVAVTTNAELTYDPTTHGGANPYTSTFNAFVAGSAITSGPTTWTSTNAHTAALLAADINAQSTTTGYNAVQTGATVQIRANAIGPAANGRTVKIVPKLGGVVDNPSQVLLDGANSTIAPGSYVKAIGSKIYFVSDSDTVFSGVGTPTSFNTDTTGAGFIDMAAEAAGSEHLTALARYNQYVAIFAGRTTQIWYMDPDPDLNKQIQVLYNTGTFAPGSVTQFGDHDLFYLDETGIRSMRARDASNSASTDDVGVPIDTLIIDKLQTMSLADRLKVFGLIEPSEGRFWLCMLDTIFVFSYFSGSSINAWTTYKPGFNIDGAAIFNQKVYLRSGDDVYVYGGFGAVPVYDGTQAEAWLPYLDAGEPATPKKITGIDIAAQGTWQIALAMDPSVQASSEVVAVASGTTYLGPNITAAGQCNHVSPRFKSIGSGPAVLGAAVIHHDLEPAE